MDVMNFDEDFNFDSMSAPEYKVFDMMDINQLFQGTPEDTKIFDYHGSSSVSPSSSLSSPTDIKQDFGCVDFSSPLCVNAFSGPASFLHSPASSSGSPFNITFPSCPPHPNGQHSGGASASSSFSSMTCGSPLPPVSQFSHAPMGQISPQEQQQQQQQQQRVWGSMPQQTFFPHHMQNQQPPQMMEGIRSPSPPMSCSESLEDSSNMNDLATLQAQQRTRSKMHEMAVKQKLITDQTHSLQDGRGSGCVQLSAEEKRTLLQEGYSIPTRLPLTKNEEEALKIVRRKIKNKLSAQESRRKRKEYMDNLEQKVQLYCQENNQLRNRLKQMEHNQRQMMARLKQFEQMMGPTQSLDVLKNDM